MVKRFYKLMSDVLWRLGFEVLSLRFLMMSLDVVDVAAPTINIKNMPSIVDDFAYVVFEDRELVKEFNVTDTLTFIKVPVTMYDVN